MSRKIYFLRRSLVNPLDTQLLEFVQASSNKYKGNRLFIFGECDMYMEHFKWYKDITSYTIEELKNRGHYKQITKKEFVKQLLLFDYKEVN